MMTTTTKTLKTIQPVSHLQNYNKYIAPVLNAGYPVHLTKGGSNYWTIIPDNEQTLGINEYARKLAGKIVEQHLNQINQGRKYTPKQVEKMVDNI